MTSSALRSRPVLPKRDELATLTSREREILDGIARGLTNAQIADRLRIAEKTVRNHVNHVFSKLDARASRASHRDRAQGRARPRIAAHSCDWGLWPTVARRAASPRSFALGPSPHDAAAMPWQSARVATTRHGEAPWLRQKRTSFSNGKARCATDTAASRPRPGSATARRRSTRAAGIRSTVPSFPPIVQACRCVSAYTAPSAATTITLIRAICCPPHSPPASTRPCECSPIIWVFGFSPSRSRLRRNATCADVCWSSAPFRLGFNGCVAACGCSPRVMSRPNDCKCSLAAAEGSCVVLQTLRNGVTVSAQIDSADAEAVNPALTAATD